MFAVAAVLLLLLLLQCAAYKDLPTDLSFGKNPISPPHPDEFSKSLILTKHSIVYGIRKTDGLLMVIEQQQINKIHDLETMQSMIDLPLGHERFEYCQVMLLEYDGITFMLMTHEELVGGKVLTTVYHVKEFRRKIHPHEKSFAFRFELYNSSLIPLKRFSDERGTRHAFRQFKERERGREPGFAVVEYNNETRASTLYFLEVRLTDILKFVPGAVIPYGSRTPLFKGFDKETLVHSVPVETDRGQLFAWVVRAQSPNPPFIFGTIGIARQWYHLDALYIRRTAMLRRLMSYSTKEKAVSPPGSGTLSRFSFRTILIIIRKGYVCHYRTLFPPETFVEILNVLEYTHSGFDQAAMHSNMKRVFAFSEYGDRTVVLAVTKWGVFYRTYATRRSSAKLHFECIPLNFGHHNKTNKRRRMIKLNISSEILAADYRSQSDTLYIYTANATYLLSRVSTNRGALTSKAVELIQLTDSFLYTSTIYERVPGELPWQIRNRQVLRPSKSHGENERERSAKTGDQIDYMLLLPPEYVDDTVMKRYENRYSFYGVKGCTVFVVSSPERVSTINYRKSGCDQNKRVKAFMSGDILTVIQETDKNTISFFRVLVKVSLERATESLLLDFTDASFSKFQSPVAGGTFDQAFVKGDSLLFIGRSEASATACILPYDMGELTGQKRVYEVVNMFKDSECKQYTLRKTLYDEPCRHPPGLIYYVFKDGPRQVLGGSRRKHKVFDFWKDEGKLINGHAEAISCTLLTYSTSLGGKEVRFVAPYQGRFMRRGGFNLTSIFEIIKDYNDEEENAKERDREATTLVTVAKYEEAEHAKVSESVFECPPLLQSPFFLPLIFKLLLIDLLLTILLIIVVLVHRTYIIPARRRQRIRRGLARAHKRRTMRERARRRLAKLRHPTEESSSEGGDELVTAAAGRGGRTTTRSEKRDAQAGENGLSPAGQPLDENAGGAVGMA